jgi:hypothetical protein
MAEQEKFEFEFPDEVDGKKEAAPKVEAEAVEVVDDTPPADRGRKPLDGPVPDISEDELSKYEESVQKRIKKITHGYHDERRAKETALREKEEALKFAQQLVEENKKLKGSVSQNTAALVEQAKRAAGLEMDQARAAYKTAYEAGDPDAVTAAQEALLSAKIKVERLANYKPPALQEEKTDVKPDSVVQNQPAPAPVDPKALAWREKNQWFGDPEHEEMTSFALGLHQKLVRIGVDPQSDEYYKRLNTRLREVFPESFAHESTVEEEKPQPRTANVVAPATRNVAPKKITLTQSQVAIAKRLGVPLELYARKVAEEMRK